MPNQKQIDKLKNAEDGTAAAYDALKRLWPYKQPLDELDETTRAALIHYMN